jgi:predicted CopG family antitoxin
MKTQIQKTISINPEDYEIIKELAKKNRRSFSSYLVVCSLNEGGRLTA